MERASCTHGDNLKVLRENIKDESIEPIYLDPPFNSQANYNVLFRAPTGEQSHAQIEAFEDTWHWGDSAEHAFDQVMKSDNTDAAELLRAMRSFLKENDMTPYGIPDDAGGTGAGATSSLERDRLSLTCTATRPQATISSCCWTRSNVFPQ